MVQHRLEQLLDRAGRGDREAFAMIYDLTVLVAMRLASAGEPDEPLAEDVLVRAYVQAWTHAPAHRATGLTPIVWLLWLVRRAAGPPPATGPHRPH